MSNCGLYHHTNTKHLLNTTPVLGPVLCVANAQLNCNRSLIAQKKCLVIQQLPQKDTSKNTHYSSSYGGFPYVSQWAFVTRQIRVDRNLYDVALGRSAMLFYTYCKKTHQKIPTTAQVTGN
jgi:hypothetical protein